MVCTELLTLLGVLADNFWVNAVRTLGDMVSSRSLADVWERFCLYVPILILTNFWYASGD